MQQLSNIEFTVLISIFRSQLSQWLWPKLLRQTLQTFMDERNSFKSRKDRNKAGPSGVSRNEAFRMPDKWGGRDCLLPIPNPEIIQALKREMGGDQLLEFVEQDFAHQAQAAYDTLHVQALTLANVWHVFSDLLPLVFSEE